MNQTINYLAITVAAISAICLSQEYAALYYLGVLGATLIIIGTAYSPWLGLLALFPFTFALPPAPATITLTEILFSTLFAAIFISTFARELFQKRASANSKLKLYAYTLAIGIFLVILNFSVAIKNNVPFLDWVRGVIPFLFIFLFLPIAILLRDDESRIRWLGCSIGVLIFMSAAYIVFFYFYHDLWKPYWITSVNGSPTKILEAELINYANAVGPMRDRITMQVAKATDALLPVGLVVGIVLATLTRNKIIVGTGLTLAITCMLAVLITFTRSMLLSSLIAIFVFSIFVFLLRRKLIIKFMLISMVTTSIGASFIFATGMQDIWVGRVTKLLEARTSEVSSPADTSLSGMPTTTTDPKNTENSPSAIILNDNTTSSEQNKTTHNNEPSSPQMAPSEVILLNNPNTVWDLAEKAHNTEPPTPIPEAVPPAVEALNNTNIVSELTEENTSEPTNDVNVSSRLHEYGIAWQMFLANPTLGNGFGVKHRMQWETSEGSLLTQYVGYVHNWPFYMLMVGGVSGFIIYSLVLFGPILFRLTSASSESPSWTVIRTALITMSVYAAFFAVFRLITFNLLIAATWGVVFAQILTEQKKGSNVSETINPAEQSKKLPS